MRLSKYTKDKVVYLGMGLFTMIFYMYCYRDTCQTMLDIMVFYMSSIGIFFIPLVLFFIENRKIKVKNK